MRSSFFFPLILVLLIIGGIALMIFWEPERQRVRSEDGLVTLSGLARESLPFTIDQQDQYEPFTSPVYRLEPSQTLLEVLAEVTMKELPAEEAIYRLDEMSQLWVLQSYDAIFETDRLGAFALAPLYAIEAPEFASLRAELHAMSPENVVGYDVLVGAQIGHAVFYLPGMDEQGGCDGGYALGNRIEQSRLEQSAMVPLNGVDELVTFVYVADWQIQDAGGCGRADLAPLDAVIE